MGVYCREPHIYIHTYIYIYIYIYIYLSGFTVKYGIVNGNSLLRHALLIIALKRHRQIMDSYTNDLPCLRQLYSTLNEVNINLKLLTWRTRLHFNKGNLPATESSNP